MALPESGVIKASDINLELGRAVDAPFNLNGAEERALAGVPTGKIKFSDFYGKSAAYEVTTGDYQNINRGYQLSTYGSASGKLRGRTVTTAKFTMFNSIPFETIETFVLTITGADINPLWSDLVLTLNSVDYSLGTPSFHTSYNTLYWNQSDLNAAGLFVLPAGTQVFTLK